MTISSTTRVAGPFTGNGSASTFSFSFKVFDETDVSVVTLATASGTLKTLALTTDYTVALNADQDSSPGGSITLTAGALATGYSLTITTALAQLQNLDLTNGGAFYPDTVNAALDTLTILVQQLQAQLARALQMPFGDAAAPTVTLPPAAERAGMVLMFDASGNPSLVPVAPGGTVPGSQQASGTVNGSNTAFTFAAAATPTPVPVVFAAGVFQSPVANPTPDYTLSYVSGSTWQITFTVAPAQGPITVVLLA